jgi:protein arginine N-methyltransferase 1
LALWFDADLGAGHGFSNAPGKPELIYEQAFFPFQAPVVVEAAEQIAIELRADLIEGDYTWSWNTSVVASSGRGGTKASFRQSTFLGDLLSPARLKHHEEGFVPVLSERAQIDRQCLALANGNARLGEIADQLARLFPHVFQRRQDALAHAARFLDNNQAETGSN